MEQQKEQIILEKKNEEEDIQRGKEGMDSEGPSPDKLRKNYTKDKKLGEKYITALNRMLSQEHACAIRYATHAAVVTGPYADTLQARLKEISTDEVLHAEKLRDRILALGGMPTLEVNREDLKSAQTLQQILSINIEEEKRAICCYTEILNSIPPSDAILFQTIQAILCDEQEHLEELESLKPRCNPNSSQNKNEGHDEGGESGESNGG